MKWILKLVAAAAILLPGAAFPQDWPSEPIHLIVPYPPGGNVDNAARIIAPGLEARLGQPIIVENRAGAGGMIAGEYVARSEPSGYVFFMAANGPLLFSPTIFERQDAYHWDEDFTPVGTVSLTPMIFSVLASEATDSMESFLAKADREDLLLASPGAGTTNHLASELLMSETGKSWRTVHYAGNAPALASLLSGETQFSFDQTSVVLPHVNSGALVPLAVTGSERIDALPHVPTIAETGLADFIGVTFTGLLGPKGVSDDIVSRLNLAMQETLQEQLVIEAFDKLGSEATAMSPSDFHGLLETIYNTWLPVVKATAQADN